MNKYRIVSNGCMFRIEKYWENNTKRVPVHFRWKDHKIVLDPKWLPLVPLRIICLEEYDKLHRDEFNFWCDGSGGKIEFYDINTTRKILDARHKQDKKDIARNKYMEECKKHKWQVVE